MSGSLSARSAQGASSVTPGGASRPGQISTVTTAMKPAHTSAAADAADSLESLREFERRFLNAGYGDDGMRRNLRRWMLEFSILHDFPAETIRQLADPDILNGTTPCSF